MRTPQDIGMAGAICGTPTPAGRITEPAALLEAWSRIEAIGWTPASGPPPGGVPHAGVAVAVAAVVAARLVHAAALRVRRLVRHRGLASVLRGIRSGERPDTDGPSALLPGELGGRLRRVAVRDGRGPDIEPAPAPAGAVTRRGPDPNARVIPMRPGPNPDATPVALPPHVAALMARVADTRRQATAHSTYVRAERAPGFDPTPPPPRAASPPTPGNSWVIDDD